MGLKEMLGLGGKKKKAAGPPDKYEDKHAKKVTALSKETANSVYKVDYKSPGMQEGYFKPDQELAPARNAVAASSVAGKLGMDDIIPETKYATHKVKGPDGKKSKQTGAVSAGVEGKAFSKGNMVKKYDSLAHAQMGMAEFKQTLEPEGYVIGPDGGLYTTGDPTYNNEMDLSNPETQSSLNRLQWFDGITGNKDRHGGNLMHDPKTGKVHGIDNDLSFDHGQKLGDGADTQEKYLGLPEQIDEATSASILAFSESDLEAILKAQGPTAQMDDKAITDAKARLQQAKAKVQAMNDNKQVLQGWDQDTYAAAAHQGDGKAPTNYLQRHMMAMERMGAASTSDPSKGVPAMPPKPQQQPQPQPLAGPKALPQTPPTLQPQQAAQAQVAGPRPLPAIRSQGRAQPRTVPQAQPQQAAQAQEPVRPQPLPRPPMPGIRSQGRAQPRTVPQAQQNVPPLPALPPLPGVPTNGGAQQRPTGGLQRPGGYGALRRGQVPDGKLAPLARPRLRDNRVRDADEQELETKI